MKRVCETEPAESDTSHRHSHKHRKFNLRNFDLHYSEPNQRCAALTRGVGWLDAYLGLSPDSPPSEIARVTADACEGSTLLDNIAANPLNKRSIARGRYKEIRVKQKQA